MCAYIEAKGDRPSIKGNVSFALDGDRIVEISYDMDSLRDWETLSKKIELKRDKPRSIFIVEAGGTAGADLTFDVVIAGTFYFKDKGFASQRQRPSCSKMGAGVIIQQWHVNVGAVSKPAPNSF